MRLPRTLNPRVQKRILMRFGVYDKVLPNETTPSRIVPDHILKPEYVTLNSSNKIPKTPEIKDNIQIKGMKESCSLAASILNSLHKFIKPGATTDDIDEFIHTLIVEAGAYPSPLHYKGFPKSVCTSVNNVAVHGIPDLRPLLDGDIINVDITDLQPKTPRKRVANFTADEKGLLAQLIKNRPIVESKLTDGKSVAKKQAAWDLITQEFNCNANVHKVFFKQYHGDCSKTFLVGNVDDKGKYLVSVTEECLNLAIECCGPNVPFCEIGTTIYRHAKRNRLTVLPAFVGHGIGQYFHGPPDIFHTLNRYPGLMKPGMTFTIEPVLSHGNENTVLLEDGWTIVTEDGARTAQVEHTVLITDDGAEILTK